MKKYTQNCEHFFLWKIIRVNSGFEVAPVDCICYNGGYSMDYYDLSIGFKEAEIA